MQPLLFLSLLVSLVSAQFQFINPPAAGSVGDYSQNPTFVLGSVMNIQWSGDETQRISMVLYQNRPNDEFEYVFSDLTNITSFKWNIATQKSLSNGNAFFFQIFIVGETSPTTGSHYFNLTRGAADSGSGSTTSKTSSKTSSTSTATSSTTASSTASPTSSTTSTPASISNPPSSSDSSNGGGLSTGAKVGMGVGIPIAVILGVVAGWFFFGRRRNEKELPDDVPTPVPGYVPPHEGHYAPNAMSEQANGTYKPAIVTAPSEIYTPPPAPVEMPNNQAIPRQ